MSNSRVPTCFLLLPFSPCRLWSVFFSSSPFFLHFAKCYFFRFVRQIPWIPCRWLLRMCERSLRPSFAGCCATHDHSCTDMLMHRTSYTRPTTFFFLLLLQMLGEKTTFGREARRRTPDELTASPDAPSQCRMHTHQQWWARITQSKPHCLADNKPSAKHEFQNQISRFH